MRTCCAGKGRFIRRDAPAGRSPGSAPWTSTRNPAGGWRSCCCSSPPGRSRCMPAERVALYTTVYAGVERYLAPWYRSVQAQTDTDFDLWISVDGLAPDTVARAIGEVPAAQWLEAGRGESPAQLRTTALQRLVTTYPAVVFVDSDDVMHQSRVPTARAPLRDHGV